jgi:prepilin-type processing-associated H-X9-DG protein
MQMYSQDNDERLMPVQATTPKTGGGSTTARWPQILSPYIKQRSMVMCPSADYSKTLGSSSHYYGDILDSTPDTPASAFYYYGIYPSYGYNYAYLAPSSTCLDGPDTPSAYVAAGSSAQPISIAAIDAPSTTIAMTDSADYGSTKGGIYAGYYAIMPPSGDWWDNISKNIVNGHVLPRHLETTNVLFADGHVKAMKLDALMDLNLWRIHKQ